MPAMTEQDVLIVGAGPVGLTLALGMSLIETTNHAAHAYFDSAIMLIFFLLIGRYCELAIRRKTRSVAANLSATLGSGQAR